MLCPIIALTYVWVESTLYLQAPDQQHGDQGCPDLCPDGVLGGAHEGFDLHRLLQGLEEQFDLPALLIDGRDGGGRQLEMIGDEHHGFVFLLHPNLDAAQAGFRPHVLATAQKDDLVAEDVAAFRHRKLLDDAVLRRCP